MSFASRQFARDLQACLEISDAQKLENLERRRLLKENQELCLYLQAQAKRRGQTHIDIDWDEYFRNVGL